MLPNLSLERDRESRAALVKTDYLWHVVIFLKDFALSFPGPSVFSYVTMLMKNNMFIGLLSIAIGSFCIAFLFLFDSQDLLEHFVEPSVAKFVGPLILINSAFYFLFLGLMFLAGKMVPYYKADKIERAKHNLWGSLICSPLIFCVCSIAIIFQNYLVKLLGAGLLGLSTYFLITGYITIKKYKAT